MRLLVLSALSREVRSVVRPLEGRRRLPDLPFKAFAAHRLSHEIAFAETGMGFENAARVFDRAASVIRPDAVISLGYCGGLTAGASVGTLVWATAVCLLNGRSTEILRLPARDRVLGRLSSTLEVRPATFLTLREWMKKADILPHVPAGAPLPVCEMETFGMAKIALERSLPFYAIRSVSDGEGEEIGFDPTAVCDASGTYRPARAIAFFISHPGLLSHAIKLHRGSKTASRNLGRAVEMLLQAL